MANEVIAASRNQVHVAARLGEMLPRCIFCLYNGELRRHVTWGNLLRDREGSALDLKIGESSSVYVHEE